MSIINKISSFALSLIIIILLVLIPSVNADVLMHGTQSGKTFVFLWAIGVASVFLIIRFWLAPRNDTYNWSAVDLLLLFFLLYLLYQNNWKELSDSLLFLELIGLIILYLAIKQQSNSSYFLIFTALSIGALVQAIYGNLQLWGYFPSHHGLFKMTGSFFNPGPYSGYLAAVFPISLGLYLFNAAVLQQNNFIIQLNRYFGNMLSSAKRIAAKCLFFKHNTEEQSAKVKLESRNKPLDFSITKWFFLISTVSLCLVLPASRSRAAWLAIMVSSAYLFAIKYRLVKQAKAHLKTRTRRVSLLISLVVLLFFVGAGLYYFKKGSADGRLLIWRVSTEMIEDKPFWGQGYDGFKKHYMNYQAEYFESNPKSHEAYVAGDTTYAFNDLIQLTVEYGIVGMLTLSAIIFFFFSGGIKSINALKSEEKLGIGNRSLLHFVSEPTVEQHHIAIYLIHISFAIILSILVFGLFSYPSQILPIKMCFVVALAIVGNHSPNPVF